MTATRNSNYVKFTYFHDPMSPRTVTAARLLDGDKMYIAWCCNRMVRAKVAFQWNNYVPFWEGDPFNKNIARKIARNRVEQRQHYLVMTEEKRKLEQMIGWLLLHTSDHVADIIHKAVAAHKLAARDRGFSTAIPVTGPLTKG